MYTETVLKHFRNPHNQGCLMNADGVGQKGNPACGDVMKMYLKIGKNNNTGERFVKDVKFETLGCAAAIAVSSILTVQIKGKSLKEVENIDKDKIIEIAGGLPASKIHCSTLGVEALQSALQNYHKAKQEAV